MQIVDIDFCTPGDLPVLLEIEQACFDDPWEAHAIEYDLNNQGSIVYLKAVLKDLIAGYAVVARGDDISHLMNIAVLPAYRGVGIALQLMLGVQAVAEDWENRRMRLEVRSSNQTARDFYSRIGFTYNTRLKGYYTNGEDALVLVAKLPLKIE